MSLNFHFIVAEWVIRKTFFDVFKRAGDPFSVSSSLGDPIRRVPVRPLGELHLEDQVE